MLHTELIPLQQVVRPCHNPLRGGYSLRAGYTKVPISWHAWHALASTMRVNDRLIRSVVFIGYSETEDDREVFVPAGTAFLVSSNVLGYRLDHLVTAAHNIEAIHEKKKSVVDIRVNHTSGCGIDAQVPVDQWMPHEDPTVDVAVLPVSLIKLSVDTQTLDVVPLDLDNFAVNTSIAKRADLMTGAPIATIGLFVSHPGQEKNLPIVRQGTIAMMRDPANPILSQKRGYMDAYLAEVRSLGGLSGSPVFLMIDVTWIGGKTVRRAEQERLAPAYLLGLMHGHYSRPDGDSDDDPDEHAGIGIVVPIDKIIEAIEQRALIEARMKVVKALGQKSKVREDKASRRVSVPKPKKPDDEPNPNHRGDLKGLLGRAARPPKSSG